LRDKNKAKGEWQKMNKYVDAPPNEFEGGTRLMLDQRTKPDVGGGARREAGLKSEE
jgi:hypothetical protein